MRALLQGGLACAAAFLLPAVVAAAPVPQAASLKPLPAEIVEAWKNAGAEVGWMSRTATGYSCLHTHQTGEPGEIPAFRFRRWGLPVKQFGGFGGGGFGGFGPSTSEPLTCPTNLPDPGQPFGLDHSDCYIPDGWLKELGRFKHLLVLNLSRSPLTEGDVVITDTDLADIGRLSQLRALSIHQAAITATGFQHLVGLTNLLALDLAEMRLTDEGAEVIANFRELQVLNLRKTQLTDAGAKTLAKLSQLRALN